MSRKFGVELEVSGDALDTHGVSALINAAGVVCKVEGYNHITRRDWKIVPDASLHGGRNMMEIVGPPVKGSKGVANVETVANALLSNGIKVNSSCGLHVHVDAAGLTLNHIKNACKLVTIHEEHMKALLPKSRHNAYFARFPSAIAGLGATIEERCAKIDSAPTIEALQQIWGAYSGNGDCARYRAINLEALRRHGTLEFRAHSGTVDAQKILAWVALMLGIVRNAEQDYDIAPLLKNARPRSFRDMVRLAGSKNVEFFRARRAALTAARV